MRMIVMGESLEAFQCTEGVILSGLWPWPDAPLERP